MAKKDDFSVRKRAESFAFAFSGIAVLLKSQPNFRIHCLFVIGITAMGLWLEIDRTQWAVIVLCMAIVLTAEAVNTAIEMTINMVTTQRSWPAKWAKDIAAAAVLISATGTVIVGLLILGPPLYQKIMEWI